jgi:hypothetical protein
MVVAFCCLEGLSADSSNVVEIDVLYYRKCHVRLQWRLLDWDGVVRNMLSLSPGLKDRYIFEEARTKGITLIARRRMTMQILLNLRF